MKSIKVKRNSLDKNRLVRVVDSNDKNCTINDFYPMNWSNKERQIWKKIVENIQYKKC